MENELKVERYDALEVETKKEKILKRVAIGVGAVTLATVLGFYGLAQDKKGAETMSVNEGVDTVSMTVKKDVDTVSVPVKLDLLDTVRPMRGFYLGGNGAWFNSVIEFLG